MKTFPSTASRLRTITRALRLGGWGCLALACVYLVWILCVHPASELDKILSVHLTSSIIPTSRPDLLDILASRSLRQEVKPIVVVAPMVTPLHPPDVEVIATIVNPGQTPSAYVRSRITKKLVSVQPGGQIDGATVKSITEGQVILELQGQEFPIQVGRKGS